MFKPAVLAKIRTEQRYSQRQLAKAAGVKPSFVAALEAGHSKDPGFIGIDKVARVLGVDPGVFFDSNACQNTQGESA